MSDFSNQAEIWKWLLDGNKVEYDSDATYAVVYFKNGELTLKTNKGEEQSCEDFRDFKDWKRHVPPKEKKKVVIVSYHDKRDGQVISALSESDYDVEMKNNTPRYKEIRREEIKVEV